MLLLLSTSLTKEGDRIDLKISAGDEALLNLNVAGIEQDG